VLSQLYLSRLDWAEVEARFFTDGFFETPRKAGQIGASLSTSQVRALLETKRDTHFAADLEGNHVGIRRFATVIQDPDGKFLHLLALAEPAEMACAPIEDYQDALLEARSELSRLVFDETAARRLQPKYHAKPMRGG